MSMRELAYRIRLNGIWYSLEEQDFETHSEAKSRATYLRKQGIRCVVRKIPESRWWAERYPLYVHEKDVEKYYKLPE